MLFCFAYPPLTDFPEWIFQACVFNSLVQGGESGFLLKPYPAPYALSQLFLSLLVWLFPPLVAAKLGLASCLALGLAACSRLVRARNLDPLTAWPLLASLFLFGSSFWNGYYGYQFGLAVFTLYLALDGKRKSSAAINCLFFLLTYFLHGMVFIAFGILSFCEHLSQRKLARFALSALPCAVLTLWYAASQPPHAAQEASLNGFWLYKAYTLLKFGPYHNFVHNGLDSAARFGNAFHYAGAALNGLFAAALGLGALSWLRLHGIRAIKGNPEAQAALVLALLGLALPATAFGIVNPGERFFGPALLLLVPLISRESGAWPRLLRLAPAGLVLAGMLASLAGLFAAQKDYLSESVMAQSQRLSQVLGLAEHPPLFGHRPFQFDFKMREVLSAHAQKRAPDLELSFDTGLIMRKKTAPQAVNPGR